MAYSGIQFGQIVDGTTERKLYAKVVDNVLNSATYYSRIMGKGRKMEGKTEDVTVDVLSDTQGEFFVGLEPLNSSAVNTTVTLSYAHTAFTQPVVDVMLEAFANTGSTGTINIYDFKYDKAAAEAMQKLGAAIYGSGSANQPLGLGIIVSDTGTIGGQSRTTYPTLAATSTASSGTLTLAKMATLYDTISASGMQSESPNFAMTTKTVWSLYEQLLQPNVRASYDAVGYNKVSVRGDETVKSVELRNSAGFNVLTYRELPIGKDDFATSGTLFFLNERYFDWMGRTIVPDEYKTFVEKVNLGTMTAYEGTGATNLEMPSEYNGWFFQKGMVLPNQAGLVARFYVIGQTVAKGFRRSGKLTGITSV